MKTENIEGLSLFEINLLIQQDKKDYTEKTLTDLKQINPIYNPNLYCLQYV